MFRSRDSNRQVIFIAPTLDFGFRYLEGLFQEMAKVAIPPTVWTTSHLASQPFLGRRLRSIRLRIPILGGFYARTVVVTSPSIIVDLIRERPCLVLAVEYSMATLWAVIAGRFMPKTRVYILQEHFLEVGRLRSLWRALLARMSEGVLANTNAAAVQANSYATTVVELPWLVPPPAVSSSSDDALSTPDSLRRFLFVGILEERKNVMGLIEACTLLLEERRDFMLVVVGEGSLRSELDAAVRDGDLEEHVLVVGSLAYARMPSVYQWAEVFIMPTFQDYRSVSVLESMRYGCAVIDSVADGNAGDSVRDGINGILVDPHRPQTIAHAMRTLIDNDTWLREMQSASVEYMEPRTQEHAAKAIAALIGSSAK